MSGGSHIAAVGPGEQPVETPYEATGTVAETAVEVDDIYELEEEEPSPRNLGWLVPAIALLAIAGWSAFFGYAHQSALIGGVTPSDGSALVTQWAVPVLLVIGLWLLAMRSSRREASRFGDAARALREESAHLEARLVTVNRELALAREFIAAQSRDLEALGRTASERLSENAERMSAMIRDNTAQIDSIASVSTTALENMDKLRADLPVVANSARDVTSQIGNAGHTAQTHLQQLINGLHRVNAFGESGSKLVTALQEQTDTALGKFEARTKSLGDATIAVVVSLNERMTALESECKAITGAIREGETTALGQWNSAIENTRSTLGKALEEIAELDAVTLDRAQSRLGALEKEAKALDTAMAERVEAFMSGSEERRMMQEAQLAALSESFDARLASLSEMSGTIDVIATRGGTIGEELSQSIEQLSEKLVANKGVLDSTQAAISGLTDASVRLLELIQAGSQHSREQLPAAIDLAEQRLTDFEARSRELGAMLGEAADRGEALSMHVTSAQTNGRNVLAELETLHANLADHDNAHAERIDGLRSALAALGEESDAVSKRTGEELSAAIDGLRGALQGAIDEMGSGHSEAIDGLAERIGEQSAEAIERVIRLQAAEAIGELEQAAAHASGVGREAARQLRDQLTRVDELAGNLESRVARARERAEEQVDNDFARRVALITEALNSHSIDIAKALSNDVTDTAWASYLRGDRGIFTRRAVRLLDNSEAREIAEIYDRDHDFREHVSRYIHDFEAMLRTMLSTRDGHALGVTLLSSDMGKLYVALAQGIERLRS